MPSRPRRSVSLHSVFERSFHEHGRSLAAWTTGCLALSFAMTALYPAVRDSPQLAQLHETYPKALRALFDVGDLATPAGYVRAEVFSFTAPLLLILLGVLWGSDLLAGEEDRGTIDLLLANPISRRRVLLEKWAALVAGTGLVTLGLGIGLAVGLPAFGMHLGASQVAAAVLATGLLGLLFGSIALALGAASGRRGLARGVSALLAVAAYLSSTLAELVGWLGPLRAASPWYHALGVDPLASGFQPAHLLVLAGITVAVVLAALAVYDRRDLAVST